MCIPDRRVTDRWLARQRVDRRRRVRRVGSSSSEKLLVVAAAISTRATFASAFNVANVGAGFTHTCAILDDDSVKCWGGNDRGQLGLSDTSKRGDAANEMGDNLPAVDLGAGRTAKFISAGGEHTCAIMDDDFVKCWGANYAGQLGLGDTSDRGDAANEMGDSLPAVDLGAGRTAKSVALGNYHSCAILDDDSVKCWGYNNRGQLGLGDVSTRGDAANEMGDNLLAVNLGAGRTAKSLALGTSHTCAVLDDDSVKCWGFNGFGQLGLGDTSIRAAANEMGDNLLAVNLGAGRTAKSVALGNYHTCAILDNDSVKCWGYNTDGQLGLGDTSNRGDAANEMGDSLPAVDLGAGRTAKSLALGTSHTCAILDDDSVKCWGGNTDGQLGLGDVSNRGGNANEMGDSLPAVDLGAGRTAKSVAASSYHTCAILDNDFVKCWGYNGFGQLGLGDTSGRGDAANEMGDNLPAVDLGTPPPPPPSPLPPSLPPAPPTSSTPSSPTSSTPSSSKKNPANAGVIAGSVVGSLVFVLIILLCIRSALCGRKDSKESADERGSRATRRA